MLQICNKVREVSDCQDSCVPSEVLASDQPIVMRGLIKEWPVVQSGLGSVEGIIEYIGHYYNQKNVGAFCGDSSIAGRYFYNSDLTSFNFECLSVRLDEVMNSISKNKCDMNAPYYYVGSAGIDQYLPGFRQDNDLKFNDSEIQPLISFWLGNRSRIAAHYDAPNNIACSVAGRRRFVLFPPSQIENLYVGPIDFTPAGQVISLVDFDRPDFERFPRFREALKTAQVVELEPGDALFLPSMWWHHVEGLSDFNVLVNYWWRSNPSFMGPGINALKHAFLNIRGLPDGERQAWRYIFNYYIFGEDELVTEHLPKKIRGILESIDDDNARKIRAMLIAGLNR